MGEKFVALVRVSTDKQGPDGLGMAAGLADIKRYIESNDGNLIDTLTEVESGKHNDMIHRPTLKRALALCKRNRATLLVPKVDRLVRSTEVHTDIKRSGVPFRAVDQPFANEFTLDILVAVAAKEARDVSDRTTKALKVYRDERRLSERQMFKLLLVHGRDIPPGEVAAATDKPSMAALIARYGHQIPLGEIEARAGKLGSHLMPSKLTAEGRDRGRAKGNARSRARALDMFEDLVPEMQAWRAGGLKLGQIADRLNERGVRTANGAAWGKSQVKRTLDRAAGAGGRG